MNTKKKRWIKETGRVVILQGNWHPHTFSCNHKLLIFIAPLLTALPRPYHYTRHYWRHDAPLPLLTSLPRPFSFITRLCHHSHTLPFIPNQCHCSHGLFISAPVLCHPFSLSFCNTSKWMVLRWRMIPKYSQQPLYSALLLRVLCQCAVGRGRAVRVCLRLYMVVVRFWHFLSGSFVSAR